MQGGGNKGYRSEEKKQELANIPQMEYLPTPKNRCLSNQDIEKVKTG